MSRYVDVNPLRHRVLYWADSKNLQGNHEQTKAFNYCLCMIDDTPTADVVEVVRCKNCTRQMICFHSDDYFCADGERREDDKG